MILEKFEDLSPPALVLRVLKNFKSPSPLYKVWFLTIVLLQNSILDVRNFSLCLLT